MTKTAVLLAAGKSQKLDPFSTHKALLLVHGKPLIMYGIERLLDAGVQKIYIVAGSSRDDIARVLREHAIHGVSYEFINGSDEDDVIETFKLVAETVADECIVASSDLIFETNPFLHLKRSGDAEFLVDPHIEHNKFSGATIGQIDRFFGEPAAFSTLSPGHVGQFTGIYWFSKEGLARFRRALGSYSLMKGDIHFTVPLSRACQEMLVCVPPLPRMTWFDINTPETLLRAEMFLRSKSMSKRQTKVAMSALSPIRTQFSFTHQKQMTTPVIVESGLITRFAKYHLMEPERTASRHIIITDKTVDALLGNTMEAEFSHAGYQAAKIVVPAGEATKSMSRYGELAEKIIALGIDEQSIIFALGGGVVANISGFLASTLYRGIGLIHIPTTFMNMIDVSISLKQGINDRNGKNLVGSYYQPLLVLIDPSIPIPDWLIRDGISEAIKHALCQDEPFFEYLLSYEGSLSDTDFRTQVIQKTIALKTELMKEDMFENYRAMVLQYGHEIGHAAEFLSGFALTHGQGISIGMRASAELAHLMGVAESEVVAAHKAIFKKYQLPYKIPESIRADAIVEALKFNKKTRGSDVRMVLPEKIGKAWKIRGEYGIPCPVDLIAEAIRRSYVE